MHETTITAQYVNPPDKYPEWGSVKAADGTRYSVPKGMVSLFQAGQSYLVGYTTNDKGYHTIKQVSMIPPPGGLVHSPYPGAAHLPPPPTNPAANGGAEKGMLTKIAVDLLARGQWSEDEIYGMIRAGQRITERVLAGKELEETF